MMPAFPLRRILLASLALNLLGVWWGLPGKWAPIELLPEYVMGGLQQHFSHGWFDAYPPLHYFVLTVAMSPFMAVSWCGVHPACMLFNVDYGRAVPRDSDWGKMMQQLEHGAAGYTLVARFREPLPWAWLPGMHRDLTGPRRERIVFTTVRNINPTIEVFAPDRK